MPFVFLGLVFGIAECALAVAPQALELIASVADISTGQTRIDGEHGGVGAGIVALGNAALALAPLTDPVGALVTHVRGTGNLGRVKVNGLWATKAGDSVTNVLVHQGLSILPLLPLPDDDAELHFGAIMVFFENAAPVRLGEMAMSCSEPIRMPASVLTIPKGPPVLILAPPAPDPMAMANLARGLIRGAVMRRVGRTNWMRSLRVGSKRLAGRIFGPGRGRSWARDVICHFTGEPVDVSTCCRPI
jgi:hypothetical protein